MEAAVWGDNEKVVQLLLEANADPNGATEDGGTILQIAAFRGKELVVETLLEANADTNRYFEVDFDQVRHL